MAADLERVLAHFWEAMAQIYGRQWYKEHGEVPPDMWRGAIGDLSLERIKATIDACRDSGDKYPITLSQFMGRAKAIKLRPPPPSAALPAPRTAKQKKHYHESLAAIKVMLNNNSKKCRSVLLAGESFSDYKAFIGRGLGAGKTMFQLKWQRLTANGWTMEDEQRLHEQAKTCGYPLYTGTTNLISDLNETNA